MTDINTKQEEYNNAYNGFISFSLRAIKENHRMKYDTMQSYRDLNEAKELYDKTQAKVRFVGVMTRFINEYQSQFLCVADDDSFLNDVDKVHIFDAAMESKLRKEYGLPLKDVLSAAESISSTHKMSVNSLSGTTMSASDRETINLPISIKRELFRMLIIASEEEKYKKPIQQRLDIYNSQLGIAKATEASASFQSILDAGIEGIKSLPFMKDTHKAMIPSSDVIFKKVTEFTQSKEAEEFTDKIFTSIGDGTVAKIGSDLIQKTLGQGDGDPNIKKVNDIFIPLVSYANRGGGQSIDKTKIDQVSSQLEDEQ